MIIAFNKPFGVLSQFNENPDKPGQKTLANFNLPPDFYPVGRLDMDSEGLLLLSDDPQFERELLRPSKAHKRTYLVQLDGSITNREIRQLSVGGLEIQNYETLPCKVRYVEAPSDLAERVPPVDAASASRSTWITVTLKEGKNRQVRRMTAKVGYPTIRLMRLKIGEYALDDLAPGSWVVLSEEEEERLTQ